MSNIQELAYIIHENHKNLLHVFGAGISAPALVPTWIKLNENILNELLERSKKSGSKDPKREMAIIEAKNFEDPWITGDFIKNSFSEKEYIEIIRHQLTPRGDIGQTCYKEIMSLKSGGIINFNLDEIALKFGTFDNDQVATGFEPSKFTRFPYLTKSWMFFPHGRFQHPSSWVLTTRKRNELYNVDSFKRSLATMIQSKRMIFWGLGLKDFSLTTILSSDFKALYQSAGGPGNFWVKNNPTSEDREFARVYNLKIIEYAVDGHVHKIPNLIAEVKSVKPRDSIVNYITTDRKVELDKLPKDEDLAKQTPEEIRSLLNAACEQLIYLNKDNNIRVINAFLKKYPRSVHQAWMISAEEGLNIYHGYRIEREINGGAFGTIFVASDPVEGTEIAVKVLRRELIQNVDFIEAFRRGVVAQALLTSANIEGMVKLKTSTEFPPSIFMDFVNGITLTEFIGSNYATCLDEIINIIFDVFSIISRAHSHSSTVLHRDLKPNNIMLREYWEYRGGGYSTVILDFDLSWHSGATGLSMLRGASLQGYASPELSGNKSAAQTTRDVLVDIYSLGMVMYFCFTGKEPYPNMSLATSFGSDTVKDILSKHPMEPFLAQFITDLISSMSVFQQQKRLGMEAAMKKLGEIRQYIINKEVSLEGDLIFFVLESRFLEESIVKLIDRNARSTQMKCGEVSVKIHRTDADNHSVIEVIMSRAIGHTEDRSGVAKYLNTWKDRAISKLSGDEVFQGVKGEVDIGITSIHAILNESSYKIERIKLGSKKIRDAAFAIMGS